MNRSQTPSQKRRKAENIIHIRVENMYDFTRFCVRPVNLKNQFYILIILRQWRT